MARYEVKTITAYMVVDTETDLDYRSYDSEQSALAVSEALNDLEVAEETMVIDAVESREAKPQQVDGRTDEQIATDAAAERLTGYPHYKGVEVYNAT